MKDRLVGFLRDEVEKRGFERVVLGLSGGLDSAVVAFLSNVAFGKSAKALLMPSTKSSPKNLEDAWKLAEMLCMPCELIPLEPYEQIFGSYEGMDRVRYGNFCARIRMMLLYDVSQRERALVIGTSNKSERILGYGTIYGDMACAINPIGDLFKSEIFEFAAYLGIPQAIISKKPSADLYEGQSDEDELGFTYEQIDALLCEIEGFSSLDEKLIPPHITDRFPQTFLKEIFARIERNRFKTQAVKIYQLENE